MTDSTIDENSGDGGFDVGASADDLFGAIEDESGEGAVDRESVNAGADADEKPHAEATSASGGAGAGGVEDRTASNVFGQLKADADVASADGTDDVLEGETPEDIIASADDPDPGTEAVDDALLADDGELTDLLLTGRSTDGEGEFHWIDPDDSGESTATAGAESASDAATPAWEADGTDLDAIFADTVDDEGGASDPDGAVEPGDADDAAVETDAETDAAVEFDEAAIDSEADPTDEGEPAAESDPSSAVESDPEADAADSFEDDEATDDASPANAADADSELEESAETPAADASEPETVPSLGADTEPDSASDADDDAAAESDDPDPETADGSGPLSRFRAALGDLF